VGAAAEGLAAVAPHGRGPLGAFRRLRHPPLRPRADNWSGPVIEALGLRRNLFPPLISSEALAGPLTREASVSLGLPVGLPVVAGSSDTAAALLGSVSVPAGAEGVTFLPYLSGEHTPHLDPDARVAWVGLDLAHGRAHLLRAAFEGVAFALRDCLEAL
jgi:sugar (pentulose or hexulose) kinase